MLLGADSIERFLSSSVEKSRKNGHSSLIATTWFPGSAWEPTELQALPAFATIEPEDAGGGASKTVRSQAEPGNEQVDGGVQREVSKNDLESGCNYLKYSTKRTNFESGALCQSKISGGEPSSVCSSRVFPFLNLDIVKSR